MDVLQQTFEKWEAGYIFWRTIYYGSGFLVIALPALVASELPFSPNLRRGLAVAAAIVAGVVTWVRPGTKATLHVHGYVCLERLMVKIQTNPSMDQTAIHEAFDECSKFIDYDYGPSPAAKN